MSWFSEMWRKLTNNPKIPAELQAKAVTCRTLTVLESVKVVGEGGSVEIVATKNGARISAATAAGMKEGNYWNTWAYADGRVSTDYVVKGQIKASIDMQADGTVTTRGVIDSPVTPPEPEPTG